LPAGECDIGVQPSALKDAEGRLWFITAKGIARIDPGAVAYNTRPPALSLEKVVVDGKELFANDVLNPRAPQERYTSTIPPGSKRVEIHYHGSNLSLPEKVQYRHMLEGLDNVWIESGNQPVAYLQDPKPGKYRFRARAANEHGIWNEAGIVLDFEVQPFFWQTLWFHSLSVVCLALVAGVIGLKVTRFWLRRQFERLEQQKAFQREQARLASVLEATSDLVAFADRDANLLYLNRAGRRMLRMNESGDLRPCKITEFLPEWAAKRVREEGIPGAIRDGIWRGETALIREKGQELPLSQVIAVHAAADGSVEFLSTIARDISDRKRLEHQSAHSQRIEAIGRLAGGVAHDFNNMLTAILGYSDIILGRLRPADPMRTEIEEIYKAAERAAALTRQLLAFSRKQTLKPVVFDLNEIVTSTERMLRRLIGEDITLSTDLQPTLWPIRADRSQLEQVIMNLALNARDAMPEGGSLTITTKNFEPKGSGDSDCAKGTTSDLGLGSWVLLTICDTGCGMDEATQSRLFEPYFTTKDVGKGTGLGLATVHGIIKQSGGHVSLTSVLGRGTTFRIWLPPCNEAPTEPARPSRESLAPPGKETVLVVEDDEFVRSLTCRLLTEHGHRVLQARQADEALSLSRGYNGPIHLLLTDVIMPGQTGPELAGRLVLERPTTKVLFMSGYPSRPGSDREHLNGDGLLMKPFTARLLLQKVRDALNEDHTGSRPKELVH
jgi:PAS domain S-box-containing protein